MRQKELRIALVCYGGISLAVYMHGVTKELWKVLAASRAFTRGEGEAAQHGSTAAYMRLLQRIAEKRGLRLRVMADILAGASAGGINSVFLAQAIQTGQSLEPLTGMWLDCADVDELLDPDARPLSRGAKFWATPLVSYLLHRPGNAVSASVAPETRAEVREKLSRLIRSRWFEPPFSGIGFSRLLHRALSAMAAAPAGHPLLPDRHPLDLSVTATDFHGHPEVLRLHSPAFARESEHRLSIRFSARRRRDTAAFASLPELVFAARATASFPGAFPPLQIAEIDTLVAETATAWPGRDPFLAALLPDYAQRGALGEAALIDGSVLVNAPFSDAIALLRNRPAAREVDRRFVYIDPTPDRSATGVGAVRAPGFFSVIFGAISTIPREQPIRDNLDLLGKRSAEMENLRAVVAALRPEVDEAIDRLFGRNLFIDWPNPRRMAAWRAKAQQQAWTQAGFTYRGYLQVKLNGVVSALARLACETSGDDKNLPRIMTQRLHAHLAAGGLVHEGSRGGNASPALVDFLRQHDIDFRIRRLRLVARQLTQDWDRDSGVTEAERDAARDLVYSLLTRYLTLETQASMGASLTDAAGHVLDDPQAFLDAVGARRRLVALDGEIDEALCTALKPMSATLRRRILLTYLGFPFYDTATLPLLRGEGYNEFDPIKVDRISPEDCTALGGEQPLRGVEFFSFGAFFSRAYRENDYLWGRLHGAERMIELIASTLEAEQALSGADLAQAKREAFTAILDEERGRLRADPGLISRIEAQLRAW